MRKLGTKAARWAEWPLIGSHFIKLYFGLLADTGLNSEDALGSQDLSYVGSSPCHERRSLPEMHLDKGSNRATDLNLQISSLSQAPGAEPGAWLNRFMSLGGYQPCLRTCPSKGNFSLSIRRERFSKTAPAFNANAFAPNMRKWLRPGKTGRRF